MVEVRINNDKTESIDYYNQVETHCESDQDDDDSSVGEDCPVTDVLVDNFNVSSPWENILKYRIVQKRWKKLYSAENSLRLQDAVKKQVFKDYFGDDGTLDSKEFA